MSCLKHNLIAILFFMTLTIGPALGIRLAAMVAYAATATSAETTSQQLADPLQGIVSSHLTGTSNQK